MERELNKLFNDTNYNKENVIIREIWSIKLELQNFFWGVYMFFNYFSTHIFNDPSFKGEGDNPNILRFCHRSQSVHHSKSRAVVVVWCYNGQIRQNKYCACVHTTNLCANFRLGLSLLLQLRLISWGFMQQYYEMITAENDFSEILKLKQKLDIEMITIFMKHRPVFKRMWNTKRTNVHYKNEKNEKINEHNDTNCVIGTIQTDWHQSFEFITGKTTKVANMV